MKRKTDETERPEGNNHNGEHDQTAVMDAPATLPHFSQPIVRKGKPAQFPDSLMAARATFAEALAYAVLTDKQRNLAVLYFAQLEMFDMQEEIAHLIYSIIGTIAIDGRARAEGLEAHTGIVWSEIYNAIKGKKTSDKDKDRLERMQRPNRDRPYRDDDRRAGDRDD
jgi:hypothetical protein